MCLRGLPQRGRVLDAGCSTGNLVRGLLELGCDAWGFDLDDGVVQEAKRRLGNDAHRVAQADLRNIGDVFPGMLFDRIVCLGQTFPHLLEDEHVDTFLLGARMRLTPGGRLFIQTVSDDRAPLERRLPTLEIDDLRLDRRRILQGEDRAILELRVASRDDIQFWRVEQRQWTPQGLADVASRFGLRSVAASSDESGAPWTGAEPGWIAEFESV